MFVPSRQGRGPRRGGRGEGGGARLDHFMRREDRERFDRRRGRSDGGWRGRRAGERRQEGNRDLSGTQQPRSLITTFVYRLSGLLYQHLLSRDFRCVFQSRYVRNCEIKNSTIMASQVAINNRLPIASRAVNKLTIVQTALLYMCMLIHERV